MNALKYMFFIAIFTAAIVFAMDHKGNIMIHSPKNMAKVDIAEKIKIDYHGKPGQAGEHLHLYVDGKREALLHDFMGTIEVGPLKAGKHKICMEINTKMHVPTGPEYCIYIYAN